MLLDTHVALWWLTDDDTLSERVKDMIDKHVDVFVSVASVWEVGIKQRLGKIEHRADVAEAMRDSDLRPLPIEVDHAMAAARLPLIHRDPFDRMLVAQALTDDLTLVTRDRDIQRYEVATLGV